MGRPVLSVLPEWPQLLTNSADGHDPGSVMLRTVLFGRARLASGRRLRGVRDAGPGKARGVPRFCLHVRPLPLARRRRRDGVLCLTVWGHVIMRTYPGPGSHVLRQSDVGGFGVGLEACNLSVTSSRRRRWDGGSVMMDDVGRPSRSWVTRSPFGPRDRVIYSGYLASITLRSPPRAANSPVTLAQTGRQDATTSRRIRFTAFS